MFVKTFRRKLKRRRRRREGLARIAGQKTRLTRRGPDLFEEGRPIEPDETGQLVIDLRERSSETSAGRVLFVDGERHLPG